jgi:RNA polymerase sigma-70 factor (ECF subfamily)
MSALAVSAPAKRARSTASRIDRDRRLVAALRRRDCGAAERLLATYGDRAYRLAVAITRNVADAEEIVQDAFWAAVDKADTFRGESAFGSWLYRIVANAAYRMIRGRAGRGREIALDEVLPPFREDGRRAAPVADWMPAVDDPERRAHVRLALAASLAALPVECRTAVLMHDLEGLSTDEVADTFAITVANAKSRVHRARLFLRKRLADLMTHA